MKPLGIYIHIPFCIRRCPYCGFYSNACDGADYIEEIKTYFDMLKRELEFRKRNMGSSYYVDSIYFGGGTPSLAEPSLIHDMIEDVAAQFKVSDDCEVSMEANPGTVDRSRLEAYRDAGVNRLSLGVQSLDDGVLRTLGRIHDAKAARRAFDDARAAGFDNVSIDLMFGVPGLTENVWEKTVKEAASMLPEHMSFYSLQIEEGTKFYNDYKMGDMVPVTDEEDRRMYHAAISILRENGYSQYEISNASLPEKECRHNLKYWTFCDYLGMGASASSFVDGVRRTNPGKGYREFGSAGFPKDGLAEDHINSDFDNAADYMITGLRLNKGIDMADFRKRFGKSVWDMFPETRNELNGFFDSGDLVEQEDHLYITEKGFDISNRIMTCFV